jgi:hypothetical protein
MFTCSTSNVDPHVPLAALFALMCVYVFRQQLTVYVYVSKYFSSNVSPHVSPSFFVFSSNVFPHVYLAVFV